MADNRRPGARTPSPREPGDEYQSTMLELLGMASVGERKSDPPPYVSSVTSDIYPTVADLNSVTVSKVEGNETLVERLWHASEITDVDNFKSSEWEPDLPGGPLGRGKVSIGWFPVLLLATLLAGGFILLSFMRQIPATQAESMASNYRTAGNNLLTSLRQSASSANLATDPATPVETLTSGSVSASTVEARADDLSDAVAEPLPDPIPLTSADPIEALKPARNALAKIPGPAGDINSRIIDVITYRTLFDEAFEFPTLPTGADEIEIAELRPELTQIIRTSTNSIKQLPDDPAFASHKQAALSVVDRLPSWQESYLDALRRQDAEAAQELRFEIGQRVGSVKASLPQVLRDLEVQLDQEIGAVEQRLLAAMDLLPT
ncbi:MAG: sporulation initiation factor Spo0A C-terminal domain-containing protein [Acidimicrobiia bacterium]|nr:sporulation initiation factor Spo0A C-terminal domain-containing protein [Acidimicrobiia bacterium]